MRRRSVVVWARTWTDKSGKFSLEAEFIELKDGKVRLKKPDGKTFSIPLDKLSDADQAYARAQAEPAGDNPFQETKGTQTVLAEGVGTANDAALKDAFRNAVRQVVGTVVDAETLINNDKLIDDKVLTYSDGFQAEEPAAGENPFRSAETSPAPQSSPFQIEDDSTAGNSPANPFQADDKGTASPDNPFEQVNGSASPDNPFQADDDDPNEGKPQPKSKQETEESNPFQSENTESTFALGTGAALAGRRRCSSLTSRRVQVLLAKPLEAAERS
ncbi:MAG: SHD1 domain-containing protein, partial [Planctomycetales bacterium]